MSKITTAICIRITPELKARSQKLSGKHISQTQQFEMGVYYWEQLKNHGKTK